MKKLNLFFAVVFLISVGSFFQQVNAQEKTKEELEKEQKILQAIGEQKKAMAEQKKLQAEVQAEIEAEEAARIEDVMRDIEVKVNVDGIPGEVPGIYSRRSNRFFTTTDEPFVWSAPGADRFYGPSKGGDTEKLTWEFSRTVKEKSFSKDYSFDVEKTVNTVVMSVMGDCKAGEIRIKIQMPNGKNYSDIVIDEFGNLNWRKSFTLSETENQDKAGEWKFRIESTKATGFFKISLQTF